MTGDLNLNPRTQPQRVDRLKVGDIVMEAAEHPAQITRIACLANHRITLFARYLWSASTERDWPLGTYQRSTYLDRARPPRSYNDTKES